MDPTDEKLPFPDVDYRPPEPANPLPIGLIGCGSVTDLHLSAYRRAGYDVVALCDVDEARARDRRDEYYPDADVYVDHAELLARDDVAVADVATHPGPRPAIVRDAIRAGTHVLSQKPFVADLETGERLVELADEAGVALAVNQNGRWAPYFAYLRELVDAGAMGDLVSGHVSVHWNHDGGYEGRHHLFYRFAIHFVDQLARLFPQPVERVHAKTTRAANQRSEIPLLGRIDMDLPGAQASVTLDGSVRAGVSFRTYVAGSEASVEVTGPNEPWDGGSGELERLPWQHESLSVYVPGGRLTPEIDGSWNTDGFRGAMGELQVAVEEGREPDHSGRDNLETMALCFAACASAVDGEPKRPGEVQRLPGGE